MPLAIAAAALGACGRQETIAIDRPAAGAFVAGGAPVPIDARVDGVGTLAVEVDGVPVGTVAVGTAGRVHLSLAPLARGRHRLVFQAEDVPGLNAAREIFVDRMPDPGVDGFVTAGTAWLVSLSRATLEDEGVSVGRLTLAAVATARTGTFTRVLAERGVKAAVAPGTETVAWIDDWRHGRGTLHVDDLPHAGGTAGADDAPVRIGRVRDFGFSPDGGALLGIDDGAFVLAAPVATGASPHRIAARADAGQFVGPAPDVVVWEELSDLGGGIARATIAAAPAWDGVALGPTVSPGFASDPARRVLAFRRKDDAGAGGVLLVDTPSASVQLLHGGVSAFGFSPDGRFLVAFVNASESGAGTLAIDDLDAPAASAVTTFPGAFVQAAFDETSSRLEVLETDGTLSEVDLAGAGPPTIAPVAADVAIFGVLRAGALVWEAQDGGMWMRRTNGAVEDAGAIDPARAEVVLAPGGDAFAFDAIAGRRHPVRRVHADTGAHEDFGEDAHRPTFLADGAFAWAEVRADSETGGLANDDLWLFPSFPNATQGARMLAQRVATALPFEVSPDGRVLAALTDLPRRGTPWAAHARCFDAAGHADDLGLADSLRREIHLLADDRALWFGPDGGDARVLFLARCL